MCLVRLCRKYASVAQLVDSTCLLGDQLSWQSSGLLIRVSQDHTLHSPPKHGVGSSNLPTRTRRQSGRINRTAKTVTVNFLKNFYFYTNRSKLVRSTTVLKNKKNCAIIYTENKKMYILQHKFLFIRGVVKMSIVFPYIFIVAIILSIIIMVIIRIVEYNNDKTTKND